MPSPVMGYMKPLRIQDFIPSEKRDPVNILPYDGRAIYFGPLFTPDCSFSYFETLYKETPWQKDELLIYGKHIITDRKIAWYGSEKYQYTYSNKIRTAIPWTPTLLRLKEKVEKLSGVTYDSCLLNLYEHGEQGLGWHFDKESRSEDSSIASLSFGEERRFDFRHQTSKETISIILEDGSLLLMEGPVQIFWKHQLPKSKKKINPRINLTFRRIKR